MSDNNLKNVWISDIDESGTRCRCWGMPVIGDNGEKAIKYTRADLDDWQPIETAPKDKRVWLSDGTAISLGNWTPPYSVRTEEHAGYSCYDTVDWEHEEGFTGGHFKTKSSCDDKYGDKDGCYPTHWMPYNPPQPPK